MTEQERREIQDRFIEETNYEVINGDGEIDIDYVYWLEKQVKNSSLATVDYSDPHYFKAQKEHNTICECVKYLTASCHARAL